MYHLTLAAVRQLTFGRSEHRVALTAHVACRRITSNFCDRLDVILVRREQPRFFPSAQIGDGKDADKKRE